MKFIIFGLLIIPHTFGQNTSNVENSTNTVDNYCPTEKINTLCLFGQSGPRFMLLANCEEFDPMDPQCFVRLPDDPWRKCYFCCQHDSDSFQKCSDLK